MNPTKRLQDIKEKWILLEKKDKHREIFGSNLHQYALKNVTTTEAIESGERYFKFSVPEDYKSYITQVSNGGAGPCSGLFPLQYSLLPFGETYLQTNADHYAKPFPFSEIDVSQYKSKLDHDKNFFMPLPKSSGGYFFLTEYGCGGFYILIVNGTCRGQVWYLDIQADTTEGNGCYRAFPQLIKGKPILFLDWIEDHLDYHLTDGNFISDPELKFNNPEQVKNLIILNKKLELIPEHFYLCNKVEFIKVNGCQLKKISHNIRNFSELKVLDLFYNDLHDLPEEICTLTNLKELYLKSNNITQLPFSIGKLNQLEVLDISFNAIRQFPQSFYQLQNLKRLIASELNKNTIDQIQENLPNLHIEF